MQTSLNAAKLTSQADAGRYLYYKAVIVTDYYIRQVSGVKLVEIMFYLRFRPSVHPSVRTHI